MIKENFIKLYENSFRENWDLPCYTDYGESVHYTYGQVAGVLRGSRHGGKHEESHGRACTS